MPPPSNLPRPSSISYFPSSARQLATEPRDSPYPIRSSEWLRPRAPPPPDGPWPSDEAVRPSENTRRRESYMDTHIGHGSPPASSSDRISDSDNDSSHSNRELETSSLDPYGGTIRSSVDGRETSRFTGILPDNPFGVDRGPFDEQQKLVGAMPILQFWIWRTELIVTVRGREDFHGATGPSGAGEHELCDCSIADRAGDWCGSITIRNNWIEKNQGVPLMFIALSDAKGFTRNECPVWTYYVPKEEEESEWDLYFVMLLERNQERALWGRVAMGKVFRAAFGDAVWDEIKLG